MRWPVGGGGAAAAAGLDVGLRGWEWGCRVRAGWGPPGGGAGEGQGRRRQALGEEGRGHGRRWPETEKAMVKFAGYLVGERKTNGKRSNSDGFDKRDTLRCRGRRDLPCGGGG